MARFIKGDIALMPFPFSGDQAYKHRPSVVLASWDYAGGTDYLTCLITTQSASDPSLMELARDDTEGGSLVQACYIRPTYLFASSERLIARKLDRLTTDKLQHVVHRIVAALTS